MVVPARAMPRMRHSVPGPLRTLAGTAAEVIRPCAAAGPNINKASIASTTIDFNFMILFSLFVQTPRIIED
jgi:hypothetical protein